MEELFVYPIYGLGWRENDNQYLPVPFHIFKEKDGNYIIKEDNHEFNLMKIEFKKRHKGQIDFENNIGDYNLLIISEKNNESVNGYGYIGTEEKVLQYVHSIFNKKNV
ncbi:MAG: hypothetical protein J5710_02130 [Treponema sp.]|nr:hypothetical protein [Treponema sp.]